MTKHQSQLTGIPTEAFDCGVVATSMVIDWATRGVKVPPVKVLRGRMGKLDAVPTNPTDWERAITSYDTSTELEGRYERLTCRVVKAGDVAEVREHLAQGKAAIVALDYGVLRKAVPNRTGSESFDGGHAILLTGMRHNAVTSWDSLLDGRYRGCPDGPVRIGFGPLKRAMLALGVGLGSTGVYACLVERATKLGGGVVIPPDDDDELPTLAGIMADLRDARDSLEEPPDTLLDAIDDLAALIGPYRGQAAPGDQPQNGVQP
jgi:hypothetical protein